MAISMKYVCDRRPEDLILECVSLQPTLQRFLFAPEFCDIVLCRELLD